MNPPTVSWRFVVGILTLAVIIVAAVVVARNARPGPSLASTGSPGPYPTSAGAGLTAERAGRAFLAAYVDPDGRVVRRDQDGDTVSEGQAYAMLVAVAIDDRAAFRSVWSWTTLTCCAPIRP